MDYETIARNRAKGLRTAALVRLKADYSGKIRKIPPGTVLVVIADKFEKVNCMVLGGDPRGEYWRIPAPWVEVLDPAVLTGATAAVDDLTPADITNSSWPAGQKFRPVG